MSDLVRVDLHCHSTLSDGYLSPPQVANRLAVAGVRWAALTDHNTVGGQEAFRAELEKHGVSVISGVEIDVHSPEGLLHLLAYGFDPHSHHLLHMLYTLRHPLRSSARYWLERARVSNGRGSAGAALMTSDPKPSLHGVPGIAHALEAVHEAGGRCFLAHPLTGHLTADRLEQLLIWLEPFGLDGIEAIYKPYSGETRGILLDMAERRHLLVSAGSDFHGLPTPGEDGPGIDVPPAYWERFLAALGPGS